ncbi:MAG: hypothetical protein WEB04_05210 [Dehalococcoidia bacterium]
MDVTNRAIIVGGALIGVFLVLLVILLAWGAPDESIQRLGDLANYLEKHNSTGTKLVITLGGLILVLLAGLLIIFELAPPETGSVHVRTSGAGDAGIGIDEVVQRLEDELRPLPSLSGVQANVAARGRKAEVKLDLFVGVQADLAATTEEALRRTRELVEGRMGIELEKAPQVEIHYRELSVARPAIAPSTNTSPTPPYPSSEPHDTSTAEEREDAPTPGA